MLVTDGAGDVGRIERTVDAAVRAGLRAVQVREEKLTARVLAALCERLRPALRRAGGVLLVNDRADVAAAAADGVHLGRRSLPPSAARAIVGARALVGFSAHDADEVAWAAAQGADYVTLSPVFATAIKPDAAPLGPERAAEITRAASLPVLWLGGVTPARIAATAPRVPHGFAVMSAVCGANDPAAAVQELLAALGARRGDP
jgi:thiamine-phosphate pyrophosphorylase